ncbi:hypothetical protein JHD47_06490 [Sulfurimonas sp. SAG-AH-194-L11]|nr:hypothetical protein [Sulfurimonas sp. SAG-AH-194-L11]MDF1877461.1 hypothetical protein [Sulfurimonas sp. SAG-AH-194-L11]
MKILSVLLLGLLSFFIVSCSNLKMGFEEDSIFYSGGVLYIYLDDENAKEGEYKVYINEEDTEVFLANHFQTRFGVKPGQTNIKIVNGSLSDSIDIFLQASNNYYLKVTKNTENKIELRQVQKSDIAADAEQSPLYTDDNIKEKSSNSIKTPKKEVSAEVSQVVVPKNTGESEVKKADSNESESETIITYDKNAGWD